MNAPFTAASPDTVPGLPRLVGTGTATSVVVANMIGTGIFTTTGLMLARLDSGWLVLACWLLGGLLALSGALCYAELGAMMPRSGGEYVYLQEIYGPPAAFLTGWTSFFVGFSAPAAASAVAAAKYTIAAGALPDTWMAEKGAATALVLVFTGVHYRGMRWGAPVQNYLTGLKLLLLFALLLAGFLLGRGSWSHAASPHFLASGHPAQLGVALLFVMFAYSGWNASAYIAEELKTPARTLPRSLLLGTGAVTLIYLLVNLLFFYGAPLETLRGVIPIGAAVARNLFGPGIGAAFSILIALALLSSLSAYILIGPRVYYAMARDSLFFRFAGRVHPRFQTPSLSIVAQGACGVLMILTGTFEQLLTYIGFALGLFPWLTVLGLVLLRRREPQRPRPYRVWGYPLTPLFFLSGMAWILVVAFFNSPFPSLMATITVASGVPIYYLLLYLRRPRTPGPPD